jgi:hypothetical protein
MGRSGGCFSGCLPVEGLEHSHECTPLEVEVRP